MRQKGFTLLELLVTLAVSSVLLTGVVLSIYQVVWGTDRSNSQVVALTDIDHAALSIKKDLMMTQNTDLIEGEPRSSVTLTWIDYTSFATANETSLHSSSYTLSGTELRRNYNGTLGIVGRNISSISFTHNGRIIAVAITATGPGVAQRSATLNFSTYIRAEEVE